MRKYQMWPNLEVPLAHMCCFSSKIKLDRSTQKNQNHQFLFEKENKQKGNLLNLN